MLQLHLHEHETPAELANVEHCVFVPIPRGVRATRALMRVLFRQWCYVLQDKRDTTNNTRKGEPQETPNDSASSFFVSSAVK